MRRKTGRAAAGAILVLAVAGCGDDGSEQTGSGNPYLIKDIVPGPGPSAPDDFTLSGRFTYFRAFDATHGREIWRTDGTEAGTMLVRDIIPGPEGLNDTINLTDVNGTVFFTVTDEEHGTELWKTNGTAAGTVLVKDINPASPEVTPPFRGSSYPSLLTNVDGRLFFVACDEEHGHELWTSDGTQAGTRLVKDILPGPGGTTESNVCLGQTPRPSLLTPFNGVLYFIHDVPQFGRELWRSDGTADGTYLLKDTLPGPNPPSAPTMGTGPAPPRTAVVKGMLFFPIRSDLWKTDGTGEGTVPVTDRFPWLLTGSGEFAFFASGDGLWRTDGTPAGTLFLHPLEFALTLRFSNRFSEMRGASSGVFFDAAETGLGYEPWFSDGTPEGTHLIEDINPGTSSSYPQSAVWYGRRVYFLANDAQNSWQLWSANDAGEDARRLTEITNVVSPLERQDEAPFSVGAGPNGIVFSARDQEHGVELWGFNPRQ